MTRQMFLVLMLTLATAGAFAQEKKEAKKQPAKRPPNPAYAPVEDVPGLPRVLLLGDSISIGYTLATREALKGVANVHRPAANCGPTTTGVRDLDKWLGDGKWDVIHFNFGLHDLKYIDEAGKNTSPDKGKVQVALGPYAKNLDDIVARLKKTGAKLIFAYTTPVPAGEPQRKAGSERFYNDAALAVMNKHGVAINDLHAVVTADSSGQLPSNVHFTPEGSKKLGEAVAKSIRAALGK